MKRVRIVVTGKVQGVFFRASTKKKANSLGIKGFVKNEIDGSVFIEAEGESHSVDLLIEWSKTGPLNAKVHKVVIEEFESLEGYTEFEIL